MAFKGTKDATWVGIDVDTLSVEQRRAYDAYKDAYRVMKDNRGAFERMMAVGVPQGQRMIFGYNFGKLSVALVVDDAKASKPKQATVSLVDYLAMQAAGGHAN